MAEQFFKLGKVLPPSTNEEWDDPTTDKSLLTEMWTAQIDFNALVGYCHGHEGMIAVYGETEEQVLFFAETIIKKLNEPKTTFMLNLKLGIKPLPLT